ncbi:MAG TPA: hypothetical protein VFC14_13870 [Burkholderiales bacterium]|nr:hypothetical protein [Burkholderiales bacterium]
MATPTLLQESVVQHDFYVPQCEIRIEGTGLPHDVLRDVSQVTYQDGLKEIDGFSITVNNWDAATRAFKYVGSETKATLKTDPRFRLFDPCNKRVQVYFGYLGALELMVEGTFTTLEPNFPSGGKPTLEVRGLNVLHKLRRKQYSDHWQGKKDSQIAQIIGRKVDKEVGKQFPLPVVVNDEALKAEDPLPYVAQTNQYDIDFLLLRARRLGYVVTVKPPKERSSKPDEKKTHLYFGPSGDPQEPVCELKWGASLLSFKPTLTTANQIKSVTVTGWDRDKQKRYTGQASVNSKKVLLKPALRDLLNVCDPRDEIVVNKPVRGKKEADNLALAILMDRSKEMVKASVTCIGLPKLRTGCKVKIEGVGERLRGTYFVTDTTHTYGDSGYTTSFNARLEPSGSLEGLE